MPRHARVVLPGIPLHVVHRGHNRQPVFLSRNDHLRYLEDLREAADETACAIHAYVLMPNHVHLLLTPCDASGPARLMKQVAQDHAQFMNWKRKGTGAFWQGRFYSCPVDSDFYFFACHRYIEMNPVRARITSSPREFQWSSFHANAAGTGSLIVKPHPNFDELASDPALRGERYLRLFDDALPEATIDEIRRTTRTGMAFGSPAFRDRLEATTGVRMSPPPMGRPRRAIVTA